MTLPRVVPIAFILLAACGGRAPAPASGPPPDTTPPPPALRRDTNPRSSLYHRLGGLEGITAVVDHFLTRVAADERINAFFAGVDMKDLKAKLVSQICSVTGGGCRYFGRTMRESHRDLDISNAHFDALVEDLAASLDRFQVPALEKTELLTILGRLRRDIVR